MNTKPILLACFLLLILACQKDNANPKLDLIVGTYSGQMIYFKNWLAPGNNYMEESNTSAETLTIAIISKSDGTLSFTGTGLLQNALGEWADLVYDFQEDNIYNNNFLESGVKNRDISIRLNPDGNSLELDYEEQINATTSTEQINFIGIRQ